MAEIDAGSLGVPPDRKTDQTPSDKKKDSHRLLYGTAAVASAAALATAGAIYLSGGDESTQPQADPITRTALEVNGIQLPPLEIHQDSAKEALVAAERVILAHVNTKGDPELWTQMQTLLKSGSADEIKKHFSITRNTEEDARSFESNADMLHVGYWPEGKSDSNTPSVLFNIAEGHAGTQLSTNVEINLLINADGKISRNSSDRPATTDQAKAAFATHLRESGNIQPLKWNSISINGEEAYSRIAAKLDSAEAERSFAHSETVKGNRISFLVEYPVISKVPKFFHPDLKHFPNGQFPSASRLPEHK